MEVGNALAHAHAREVIHRDIKPENIMLSAGQAIVMDFGLARAIGAGSARITAMGLPLGTPAYMSPEQIQGDDADARSDIYGLGCVIYEMTTGSPPFIGNLGQVMRMHVNDAVTPPSQKRPGLPSPLDKLVAKALAKKPADRYQRAEDLVRDLEVVQAVATIEATTEGEGVAVRPSPRGGSCSTSSAARNRTGHGARGTGHRPRAQGTDQRAKSKERHQGLFLALRCFGSVPLALCPVRFALCASA